jgi:putative Ca2+/H+ antiporter (TMEM165/GDT1 family)
MFNNSTSELDLFNNIEINITNLTHVNDTYVLNILERFPKITFFQSFFMTFLTLIGDETFILLMLLKQQFPKSHLIFFACSFSLLILNTINVLIGRSLDLLLYQNFIDLLAIIIFIIIGIKHFLRFFDKKKRLTFNQEIKQIIKPENIIDEEEQNDIINFKKILQSKNSNNIHSRSESKEDYIYQKYYEGHSTGYLFWIFGKTVFISVFGDSYMFAIITNSAISNFKGTIYGSSIAILIVVFLACYNGGIISNHLSEGKMGVIISFIYFWLAAEIFYLNKYFNL